VVKAASYAVERCLVVCVCGDLHVYVCDICVCVAVSDVIRACTVFIK
jgi:hypothetical protein